MPSSRKTPKARRLLRRKRDNGDVETEIRPFPQESLLIDAVGQMGGQRVHCTSPGLAQFAAAAAQAIPAAVVTCVYIDLYRANLAATHWQLAQSPASLANLQITCAADLPVDEADIVALPCSARGEAELTCDLIQTGYERLRIGGRMFATTDNPTDTWLGEQLHRVFRKFERRQSPHGALYVGTKTEPLKKAKDYSCTFAFRDRDRLIQAMSRPGVFSHRHIDPGARHLINEMQVEAGMRVIDIGCGAGAVALAAACRDENVQVHAVDSSARAIECVQRGAELNGLRNITTELNADGNYIGTGAFDLALANPPYYASFQIARHFLIAGQSALRPGGRMLVVTKQPEWYRENLAKWFDRVTEVERKGYHIFTCVRSAK